jgi:NADH-quinone oxidoreductase subunit M
MSSIGLPGLNGFVGEFLILVGMFQRAWVEAPGLLGPQLMVIAVLAVSGVVLGAWYMLWMVQRVFFGPLKEAHLSPADAERIPDLRFHEVLALTPLLVFIVWIGVYPKLFLQPIAPAAMEITDRTTEPMRQYYAAKTPTKRIGVRDQEAGVSKDNLAARVPLDATYQTSGTTANQ